MTLTDARSCWALVSGASAGLGAEFCRQLAAAGVNVAMVARSAEPMQALANELTGQYSIKTLVCVADLTDPDAPARIASHLQAHGLVIRLLVNNAAVGQWKSFEQGDPARDLEMMRLDALAVVAMCRVFLPHLMTHRDSAIINVSSQAAYQPTPYMAVYGAAKAFVQSFSQSLFGEFKSRGIYVMTFVPGPTRTSFDAKAGGEIPGLKRASCDEVVRAALRGLGSDKPVVSNLRSLWQQRLFAALAPPKMVIRTVMKMFKPPVPGTKP